MGRYVAVAADDALEVVVATERSEPQRCWAARNNNCLSRQLRKLHEEQTRVKDLLRAHRNPRVLQVQLRGEYAYGRGEGGLRVYDVAQIDQKGFSERIVTAPVSRFGQKFWCGRGMPRQLRRQRRSQSILPAGA